MIQLATKTLEAIDSCISADQGASFRVALQKILPHMSDAYRGEESNPFRSHLGSSIIGKDCARAIWYSFRWFTKPAFESRMIRLFNRGHLEEARFLAMLLAINCKVYQQDSEGRQFRIVGVGGHFGGSGDGVAINLPDFPAGTACLLEFKTHNDKSFKKLVANGVKEAKPEHYVQMQIYMRKMNLTVAMYGAVNKNDDALHLEIIYLDAITADQFLDRAQQIIFLREPPKKLNESPGWYACNWCDQKPVCHLNKRPERNCRTCYWSIPRDDGKWYCSEPEADAAFGDTPELSEKEQLQGCDKYTPLC